MSKQIPPPTPEINRLRAAAALIPIIESGLLTSKLSIERALRIAAFCEWTVERPSDDPNVVEFAKTVDSGLKRIKSTLLSSSTDCKPNEIA